MRPAATLWILGPFLGQVEPAMDRPSDSPLGIVTVHRHLAIGHFAQRAFWATAMRFRADADILRAPPRVDREPLLRFPSNEIAWSNRSSCPCTCVRSLRSWLTTLLKLVILPLSWNNFIVMDVNPVWPPT